MGSDCDDADSSCARSHYSRCIGIEAVYRYNLEALSVKSTTNSIKATHSSGVSICLGDCRGPRVRLTRASTREGRGQGVIARRRAAGAVRSSQLSPEHIEHLCDLYLAVVSIPDCRGDLGRCIAFAQDSGCCDRSVS